MTKLTKERVLDTLRQLNQEIETASKCGFPLYEDPYVSTIELALKHYINNQWQPIETAPKDNEKVLVRGYVQDTDIEYFEVSFYDEYLNRFMCTHGKREVGSAYLTHWMPLPQPPESETTQPQEGE